MKYKNTMSYYYTNVKGLLEQIEIPSDDLFGKVKEGIISKIDSQLCSGIVTVFEENIMPMISVLEKENYPFKNNIYDPTKIEKIKELTIHLNILLSIYSSESNVPDVKKTVVYDRIPNPNVITKNGVMAQYEDKIKLPDRLPNI